MSKRAEERGLEAYPYFPTEVNLFGHKTITADGNSCDRAKFIKGYEQAEKDLGLHDVKESLPPMDEEVIVLRSFICADGTEIDGPYQISFGHIVDTERCIDYNGWNIPGVRFWMPMPEIPKEK